MLKCYIFDTETTEYNVHTTRLGCYLVFNGSACLNGDVV